MLTSWHRKVVPHVSMKMWYACPPLPPLKEGWDFNDALVCILPHGMPVYMSACTSDAKLRCRQYKMFVVLDFAVVFSWHWAKVTGGIPVTFPWAWRCTVRKENSEADVRGFSFQLIVQLTPIERFHQWGQTIHPEASRPESNPFRKCNCCMGCKAELCFEGDWLKMGEVRTM